MASASAMPSDCSTAVGVNQGRPRTHATPVLSSMRIDQVGGLVAPPSLREACRHLEAGRIGAEEMRAAEGVAIRAVLRKQEEIGIPVLSDGELRRKNFQEGFSLMPPRGIFPSSSWRSARNGDSAEWIRSIRRSPRTINGANSRGL